MHRMIQKQMRPVHCNLSKISQISMSVKANSFTKLPTNIHIIRSAVHVPHPLVYQLFTKIAACSSQTDSLYKQSAYLNASSGEICNCKNKSNGRMTSLHVVDGVHKYQMPRYDHQHQYPSRTR